MPPRSESRHEYEEDGSMDAVTSDLLSKGYLGEFTIVGPAQMRCEACQARLEAHDVLLREAERVDVGTDPEDQSIVTGLECPSCGARGTHVFSYGSAASFEDKTVFGQLRNVRAREGSR